MRYVDLDQNILDSYEAVAGLLHADDDTLTPERHLPTPGQHGHSPQRHTDRR